MLRRSGEACAFISPCRADKRHKFYIYTVIRYVIVDMLDLITHAALQPRTRLFIRIYYLCCKRLLQFIN